MLVRFSSVDTESITMFGDVAVQLIKMLGASGSVPGAISAQDIPAAIEQLRARLKAPTTATSSSDTRDRDNKLPESDDDVEPPISLSTRAVPLIDILQRASAADAPVMWDKA